MKTFESYVRWTGGNEGELTFENGDTVKFSSPVDYGGVEGSVVPEELLVASLNTCLQMAFLAYARKMRVGIESFESEAEGHLDRVDHQTRFVKCILRPRISVSSAKHVSGAKKAISLADKNCFITNSVNFEVTVEPSVQVAGADEST